MLLEKLLKEFNFSTNIFNWEEFKLFDQYFERILVSKGTFLIKEGETERYSYFVFDGILRCWLLNHNGEEQTFWFCKEGTFSMSNRQSGLPTSDIESCEYFQKYHARLCARNESQYLPNRFLHPSL